MRILLNLYKVTFSHLLRFLTGVGCRFTPTCSEYAAEAIEKYGVFRGTALSLKRVAKCHPGTPPGFDPVP